MTQLLADIIGEGSGPLTTISAWNYEMQLDQAGGVQFAVAASDPQARYLDTDVEVQAYLLRDNLPPMLVGGGIVEQVSDANATNEGLAERDVDASDLLIELGDRTVHTLELGADETPITSAEAIVAIMAFAPAGWAVDIVTYAGINPDKTVLLTMSGESVLEAAVKLAEATGMHFRLHPTTPRTLQWLFDVHEDSRVIATSDAATAPDMVRITRLRRVVDQRTTFTRIYPFGSGNADARLTLRRAQRFGAPGSPTPGDYVSGDYVFHLDEVESRSYIAHVALDTAHRRDRQETFSDIDDEGGVVAAANMLFDAAFVMLQKHLTPLQVFELDVVGGSTFVYPGQTLRVVYNDYVGTQPNLSIDANLHVLAARIKVDKNGVQQSVGFRVATVDRQVVDDKVMLERTASRLSTLRAHPQPVPPTQVSGPGTVAAMYGGTGIATYPIGATLVADTVSTLVPLTPGSSGQVLTSQGAGSTPTYTNVGASTITGVVSPDKGGTGVDNGANALTIPTTGTAALQDAVNSFSQVNVFESSTTFNDNLMVWDSTILLHSSGGAATRELRYRTLAATRWALRANDDSEVGSDSGSNWALVAFTDASAEKLFNSSHVIEANRATGAVTMGGALTVKGGLTLGSFALTMPASGTVALRNTTNIFTAIQAISAVGASAATYLAVDGDSGFTKAVRFHTGGVVRWFFGTTNTAETGSDSGTNFSINRYTDSGTFLATAVSIGRANGNIGLNGGLITATLVDTLTATVTPGFVVARNPGSNAAAGFGVSQQFQLRVTNSNVRDAGQIAVSWATATDASRKALLTISAYDFGGAREGFRVEASGTVPMIGFYGATAVVKPTALTAADPGVINSGDATTDTIIANMRTRINELETKLRSLGLLT